MSRQVDATRRLIFPLSDRNKILHQLKYSDVYFQASKIKKNLHGVDLSKCGTNEGISVQVQNMYIIIMYSIIAH